MDTHEQRCHRAADVAAQWWGERLLVGRSNDFESSLRKAVLQMLLCEGEALLKCDYDPCDILLDALHEAGIPCTGVFFSAEGILPMKNRMRVSETHVNVREGRTGQWTEIWKA